MKLDLKKELSTLYKCSTKNIEIIQVPKQTVISIDGKGNPNSSMDFKNAIEALFSLAYTLKFVYKKLGYDYVVMPLEGFW